MRSYKKIKERLLKNKIIRQEYKKLGAEFVLAQTIISPGMILQNQLWKI